MLPYNEPQQGMIADRAFNIASFRTISVLTALKKSLSEHEAAKPEQHKA